MSLELWEPWEVFRQYTEMVRPETEKVEASNHPGHELEAAKNGECRNMKHKSGSQRQTSLHEEWENRLRRDLESQTVKRSRNFQAVRCRVPLAGDSLLVMGFSSCTGASSQG